MFEEVLGIPAHPLLVHAAVVFVPLQILAAIAYGLVPFVRRHIAWLVIVLAVVAPLSALFAKLSGDAFRDRMVSRGTATPDFLPQIDQHNMYGDRTMFFSIGLSVLMILLMLVQVSRSRLPTAHDSEKPDADKPGTAAKGSVVAAAVLTVAVVATGAVTGYYVFKTGDSGAHMVWDGL